jgi:hypothetical protein
MGQPVDILLLDDGELDDVQQMLEGLDLSFGRVRGGAIADDTPPPASLLISTPRRISAICGPVADARGGRPVRVIVVNEDSTTLRKRLRQLGFDYLVRRPVHPEALRLLLLHCLYTGEERRKAPRVPIGYEVSFRSGLLPRRSTLADLSVAGCRLLSRYALEPGRRIKVEIPQALGAAEPLSLRGRILRNTFDERLGSEGLYVTAVAFEKLPSDARRELEWVLEEQAQGPPTMDQEGPSSAVDDHAGAAEPQPVETEEAADRSGDRRAVPATPAAEPLDRVLADPSARGPESRSRDLAGAEVPPLAEPGDPGFLDIEVDVRMGWGAEENDQAAQEPDGCSSDRRSHQRGAYDRKIPAFGERALRVLVGRDLSVGGMRVERNPELEIGDRLHLAIYGAAGEEPSLVWATVARNEGNATALAFDPLEPEVGDRLERLVADLPAVESLHDQESEAMGTVVSEILET